MPDYSKASRGLFVLVEVGRVFTANAISPSEGSRQLLARYAFRAGHQLSDKELRYRRTVLFCYSPALAGWSRRFRRTPYVSIRIGLYHPHYCEVWRIVSEDSPLSGVFPADCPYSLDFQELTSLLPNWWPTNDLAGCSSI